MRPCTLAMEHSCIETLPQDQARSSHSISILEALKVPRTSELTRKRKVHCNPPPKGKRRARGEGSSEPKTVQGSKTLFTFQVKWNESKCGSYRFPCVISILLISKCIWPESRVSSLCCSSWRHRPIIWSTSFWKRHESDLPNWSRAARQVLLVQLSSAASERVFSLLKNSFGDRQNSALQDYIEASLMLQYNNR